jgi:hypothetical protein
VIVTGRTLLAIVAWPVAIAPHLLSEPAPLFVARDLKTIARVDVRAARAPVAGSGFPGCAPLHVRLGTLLVLRFPKASPGEPLHHRVRMPRLQLPKRGRELFRRVRAKGGGLAFEDDRPVMVPGRHAPDYGSFAAPFGSSRFSFSMSVVRFRFSSFAACRLFPRVRSSDRRISASSTPSM